MLHAIRGKEALFEHLLKDKFQDCWGWAVGGVGWGEGALRRKVVLVGKFSETFAYVNLQR